MRRALYPGSFDPVTNGHVDIATRAARIFDEVVIAVYDAPPKKLMFLTEERVQMFKKSVAHLPNVRVVTYKGLTVTFAREIGAQALVRGLRASSDFEYEFEMALMNGNLAPEIEVGCLMSKLDYLFLSSSLLKEVNQLGGDITNLVPAHVATALKSKSSTDPVLTRTLRSE